MSIFNFQPARKIADVRNNYCLVEPQNFEQVKLNRTYKSNESVGAVRKMIYRLSSLSLKMLFEIQDLIL